MPIFDSVRGSYVLLIHLAETQSIPVGKLGEINFPQGYYAYVGSAQGKVAFRLRRCLNHQRKLHWHIDFLLQQATIFDVFTVSTESRLECLIADGLYQQLRGMPNFGSSDCRCRSHLFFTPGKGLLRSAVRGVIQSLAEEKSLIR